MLQESLCKTDSGIIDVEGVCVEVSERMVSAEEISEKAGIDPTAISIRLLGDVPISGSGSERKMWAEELLDKLLLRLIKAMEEAERFNVLGC